MTKKITKGGKEIPNPEAAKEWSIRSDLKRSYWRC
jgi:hypothetical protein